MKGKNIMNERLEKKADNINLEYKQRIDKIDNDIENKTNDMKTLNNIKDGFIEINKSFDKIFQLFSTSIKGKQTEARLNEMAESNIHNLSKITENIDDDRKKLQRQIDDLVEEKNNIQKEKQEKE